MPLAAIFAARHSFMATPQVVVDTMQPARLAKDTKSKKCGCKSGSPHP